jgi:hypothetical protein
MTASFGLILIILRKVAVLLSLVMFSARILQPSVEKRRSVRLCFHVVTEKKSCSLASLLEFKHSIRASLAARHASEKSPGMSRYFAIAATSTRPRNVRGVGRQLISASGKPYIYLNTNSYESAPACKVIL